MVAELASPGMTSWVDVALGWRDRLLASPRFRRWAAAFPLTRPIARQRTKALFDLCAGFVYAQILAACVRLDLFEILATGPQSAAALAHRLDLSSDAVERLLAAATALKLTSRRRDGRVGLGPLGAAMVGNPGIVAMIEHHAILYADLADPVGLLRDPDRPTGLGAYWGYATSDVPGALPPDRTGAYSALMAASQPMIAAEVLDAYPFRRFTRILDVGGGEGAFLSALAERVGPASRLTLFDLPSVAERANARFARAGLGGRIATIGGDFFKDPLPLGADLATLVRVLHDHDDEAAFALLRALRRALEPDGTLLIAEPMAGTPGAEAAGDAYFGFYLLAMRRGRPRTEAEIAEMLSRAGFSRRRAVPTHTPLLVRLIEARP